MSAFSKEIIMKLEKERDDALFAKQAKMDEFASLSKQLS